jgi:16S rRNA G966 N2-methylase RsmD
MRRVRGWRKRVGTAVLLSTQSVATQKNHLYYCDNYEVLQRYMKDESVDLIYLDPPVNSRQRAPLRMTIQQQPRKQE